MGIQSESFRYVTADEYREYPAVGTTTVIMQLLPVVNGLAEGRQTPGLI